MNIHMDRTVPFDENQTVDVRKSSGLKHSSLNQSSGASGGFPIKGKGLGNSVVKK